MGGAQGRWEGTQFHSRGGGAVALVAIGRGLGTSPCQVPQHLF